MTVKSIEFGKERSGLTQIRVDGRILLDGKTGAPYRGDGSGGDFAKVVRDLQNWDRIKLVIPAPVWTGVDPAEPGSDWTVRSYREF